MLDGLTLLEGQTEKNKSTPVFLRMHTMIILPLFCYFVAETTASSSRSFVSRSLTLMRLCYVESSESSNRITPTEHGPKHYTSWAYCSKGCHEVRLPNASPNTKEWDCISDHSSMLYCCTLQNYNWETCTASVVFHIQRRKEKVYKMMYVALNNI